MSNAMTFKQVAKRAGESVARILGIRPLVPAVIPVRAAIPAALQRASVSRKGFFVSNPSADRVSKCADNTDHDAWERALEERAKANKGPKDMSPKSEPPIGMLLT